MRRCQLLAGSSSSSHWAATDTGTPAVITGALRNNGHCTDLYTVHCSLCTVHCMLCTVRGSLSAALNCPGSSDRPVLQLPWPPVQALRGTLWTLYTVHCTLYTAHYTLYSIHYNLYSIHSICYTLNSTLHIMHCTQCSAEAAKLTILVTKCGRHNLQCESDGQRVVTVDEIEEHQWLVWTRLENTRDQ